MADQSSPPGVADVPRVTTKTVQEMKEAGVPIAMLTAYDYTSARIFDSAGVDVLLVGDSAANVMAGHETTLPMTLDQMIYHAQCVVRGIDRALVVVDLPFGTYQGDSKEGLQSAIRVMKEAGAHAVKLEGGAAVTDSVEPIPSPMPSALTCRTSEPGRSLPRTRATEALPQLRRSVQSFTVYR